VELIGAGFCDHIDHAAGRPTEFCRETVALNLKLLNGLLAHGEGEARPLAASDAAEERLVIIRAVDVDVVVDAALAGDRKAVARRPNRSRRRKKNEVWEPATVDRQFLDLHAVDVGASRGARSLD